MACFQISCFIGRQAQSARSSGRTMRGPGLIPDGERITVPTGYAAFPTELLHPPRSLAERVYGNIQRWTKMEKGGHFGALEQPELLAREIREFFRPLR